MKFLNFGILLIFLSVFTCAEKSSTPEEFLNHNKTSQKEYNEDKENLESLIYIYMDSINSKKKIKSESNILSISIDTIFYGTNNKIAFLYLSKNKNPYEVSNKEGIQFVGGCFIGYKNSDNTFDLIDRLKYRFTTSESSKDLSRGLRNIYLREKGYVKDEYNINDIRFWDSTVWVSRLD